MVLTVLFELQELQFFAYTPEAPALWRILYQAVVPAYSFKGQMQYPKALKQGFTSQGSKNLPQMKSPSPGRAKLLSQNPFFDFQTL
jgi:hypothetical protein